MAIFERATFGNRDGSHQLLTSSIPASSPVLDTLRFLVDRPAGHIGSGVNWSPYWGCQGLQEWWVLWRGEEDLTAPRKNMVRAEVVLVAANLCGQLDDLEELLAAVGFDVTGQISDDSRRLAGVVVERLSKGGGPAIVPDISLAPMLLRSIWPRLWAGARSSLSLRTQFGADSLDSSSRPSIIVFPAELRPRWRAEQILQLTAAPNGPTARWFAGDPAPQLERLLAANLAVLPGDLTVLERVERIEGRLERLHSGEGTLADALLVVRTLESFKDGFNLPTVDLEVVTAVLERLKDASSVDVRTASLMSLAAIPLVSAIKSALSTWVQVHLPSQNTEDALWILEHHTSETHATWWRESIGEGLDSGCQTRSSTWSSAVWRWWGALPHSISWLTMHFDSSHEAENWIVSGIPVSVSDDLLAVVGRLCRAREWPTLLVRTLGIVRPLPDCIRALRQYLRNPESGLDTLLAERSDAEVIDAAAAESWPPLLAKAVALSVVKPNLIARVRNTSGFIPLFRLHLIEGGAFPSELVRGDFLGDVFNGVILGDKDFQQVAKHLGREAGTFALDHPDCDQLLALVNFGVTAGAVDEWWRRFLSDVDVGRPPPALCLEVLNSARNRVAGLSITFMIRLLYLFPEISEASFEEWMKHTGFDWADGNHQQLADLLVQRNWKSAAYSFRWSWKRELKLVAWHANALLTWSNRILFHPGGAGQISTDTSSTTIKETKMAIDLGIITMKEEEYEALLDKFAPTAPLRGNNRDYDVATIVTERGECRVAITRCVHQGNAHAQSTATELLGDLSPGFVLVVGIAGGIPTTDFCLGDVVVSDYIHDLTIEDTGAGGSSQRYNALGGPLDPSATRIVERLRAVERTSSGWNELDMIAVPRPALSGAFTTDDAAWNAEISTALERHAVRNAPIATARKIASSDRLIKDPELLRTWRTVLKSVSAVEMESAGVYLACQRSRIPVLAIRGISDIVGWKRDEAWTIYACHTAAAYTRMLVGAGVFCPRAQM